ncbi:MAG: membrane protein insertase YidC [Parvularculaceae bacterium]|nr:membrane protein insertase YidC [Parvularculaceae bacterium]
MIAAIAISAAILIGWDFFVLAPQREAAKEAFEARQEQAEQVAKDAGVASPDTIGIVGAAAEMSIDEALAKAPGRVEIRTPSLQGSINLAGGRLDDLLLKNYHEELSDESPMIRLLTPAAIEHGHYMEQGWVIAVGAASQMTQSLEWTAPQGAVLTPQTPLTLTARSGGLVFEKTFSVDDMFMFEVTQTVRNEGDAPATLTPYGLVDQRSIPDGAGKYMILHEGPIAVVGDSLYERKYKKAVKTIDEANGEKGWVGITNKYWLAAAIPPQDEDFKMSMRNIGTETEPVFRVTYTLGQRVLEPGSTLTLQSHLYGGSKDVDILQSYEKSVAEGGLGVWDFDKAIDWGNLFFLTRPIFYTLNFFGDHLGNFGLSILLLTLIIKALLFPLANKSYESMAKMKKLQPELEKLKERYPDDKMKLQQEMMALYQKEKLNPLAGCLPILFQMPIFYALYKTLFVTIELRHEPFVLWIKDLSAPDPTTVFNLFGLLPYDPTALPVIGAFLGIGVLPLLMGVAMWFQTKLNPPATDPIQQQVMTLMPIMFTFLFASFASGLVLYWFWNTVLSILQQWLIIKRNGGSVDWGTNLPFLKSKSQPGST